MLSCESCLSVFLGNLRVEVPSLCDMIEISRGEQDLLQGISPSETSEQGSGYSQIHKLD